MTASATRHIVLGRHNELATSLDRRLFYLVNGPWPKAAEIEVYRSVVGGDFEFVPASEYSANPSRGTISLLSIQNPETKLSVSLKFSPFARIACVITNYGEETASVDHIGLTYNVTQRIEQDSSGIKRKPISDIYELSSSSSSTSELEGLQESSSSTS